MSLLFLSKYRSIYTGGSDVATIMAYPHEGVMLVDGATGNLTGTVETNAAPSRVIWVPDEPTGFYCESSP